jgi:hypothetical protein
MAREPNKARGEVALTLGKERLILAGNFQNTAAFQTATNVEGLPALLRLVAQMDAAALYHGVRTLAVDGDTGVLDGLPFHEHMAAVQTAVMACLTGSVEEADPDDQTEGEGSGATE